MSLLAVAPSSEFLALSVDLATPLSGSLAAAGLLGMGLSDWIWGESEDEAAADDELADLLGGEEALDDLGGADELGSEQGAGDEFDGGDDLGGEFDDGLTDEPSSPDGSEFEPRLDDVEDDLEALQRSVETLREENEGIGESVDEIQETVTKLLEIYEVVTQGVNPFNEEVSEGEAPEEGFGLFDEPPGTDQEAGDTISEDDAIDLFDVEEVDEAAGPDEEVTFDELKAEYDEEAEAVEREGADDEAADSSGDAEPTPTTETDVDEPGPAFEDEPVVDDPESAADTVDESSPRAGDEGPYLSTLPDGYVQELVVLEWLGSLLEQGGIRGTRGALQYYEDLGWLGGEAVRDLETALVGLHNGSGPAATATDGGEPDGLDHRDHVESLEYIVQLAGEPADGTVPISTYRER